MAKQLAPTEVQEIQKALNDARAGRATLTQLAHAHDLAVAAVSNGVYLNGTVGELREHIHNLAPEPAGYRLGADILRDTVIGTVSGLAIYYLMTGLNKT